MSRKGSVGRCLRKNVVYLILASVFLAGALVGATVTSTAQAAVFGNEPKVIEKTYAAEELAIVEQAIRKTEQKEKNVYYSADDVELLAKLIYGEARGVETTEEKAAVVWCVLNRVDSNKFPSSIEKVVTQECQFVGYSQRHPVDDDLKEIAEDVLKRWCEEKDGASEVGRVLPREYVYFVGDGIRNYFTAEWKSDSVWDWSLRSPYQE